VEAPANIIEGAGGTKSEYKIVNGLELFETEMYMSGMHGGHADGKTLAFKRCVFLQDVRKEKIASRFVKAMDTRPTQFCYFHLLHGGGAVSDVPTDATAFGCRDWDFACVVTGVWPRDQDDTESSRSAIQWVYDVVEDLLPLSCGAYGADLGPDPRDAALAAKAFGPNLQRLIRLKKECDPKDVLAYACPFPRASVPKLIILITGESCAGKDYCANVCASAIIRATHLSAHTASISDATKRQYAAHNEADIRLLLEDRDYKELHRPRLTAFFQEQVRQRPNLPEEHFLDVVHNAVGIDVLLITGMNDEAPVATFSHLVPESKLIEVRIEVTQETHRARGGVGANKDYDEHGKVIAMNHRPSFIFHNDAIGSQAAEDFVTRHLLPFFHPDLERLASMAHSVLGFPRPEINFRHVLGISQHRGGLALSTNQLQQHFSGHWAKVDAIVCCEAGGFVFASPLALQTGVPLALIRKTGKLPPPHASVTKATSHILTHREEGTIEIEQDAVAEGTNVVVVDDVLATGETLCAVLELMQKAGVAAQDISVMVVAEFPVHCGRELLRKRGFGNVGVQSLLVFGGA
jgi:adenine phosphoribosyltransferase